MKNKIALLALLGVNLIYAVNYLVVKGVSPRYITPTGFVLIRIIGAGALFWLINLFTKNKEKIERSDWPRLALAGLFGVALNQTLFFEGLVLTTPVNAALIMTSNPIFVLLVATFALNERLSWRKIIGILLGLAGAIVLIQGQSSDATAPNPSLGNFLVLINALSYGMYLVVVKPLMAKYQPITVIKWVFTVGFFLVFPFGINGVLNMDTNMPAGVIQGVIYVVLFTTFFAYLLSIFALKKVAASVVSTFIYLQPAITALLSFIFFDEVLDIVQITSGIAIFIGVYLVSFKKKTA